MTLTATPDAATPTRRRGESNGATFWLTTFLGSNLFTRRDDVPPPTADAIYPMAFLVEQDPGATVQAHFHQADQFQVVVGGRAEVATHAVDGVAVHFAAAFTPYGPIRAGGEGVTYFTLRNGWDPGARYMPGARAELRARRRGAHREAVSTSASAAAPPALRGLTAVACDEVLRAEPDGLGAWRYRAPPGAPVAGVDPRQGRGQMWLVTAGSATRDGAALPARTCLFVFPDDRAMQLRAGPDGAELLCLQYPRRVTEEGRP